MFVMIFLYYFCVDILLIFFQECYIFIWEMVYNVYCKLLYVFVNVLIYILFLGLLFFVFVVMIFWVVGLVGGFGGFCFFFFIIWVLFWVGNFFVIFLLVIILNVILGYIIVVVVFVYFFLLSGFFRIRDRIFNYWIWFYYILLIKYLYEVVVCNEFMRLSVFFCYEIVGNIFFQKLIV